MSVDFRHNEFMIFLFFILPFLTQKILKTAPQVTQTTLKINSILDRIPLKLMLCTVILGLILHNWYPFSAFPMFSKFYPQPHYYFVTDENKKPIATWREFGLSDSFSRKIISTRLRHQATTLEVVNESESGAQFLRYLLTIRQSKDPPKYKQLQLWKTIISLSGKQLAKEEYSVASITVP